MAHSEQQVTSLEQNKSSAEDTVQDTSSQESNTVKFAEDTLDTLSDAVNDITNKAEKLVSDGPSNQNQEDFFTLQGEFHEIENRLDNYEDHIEYELRQGNLSHDEARKAEYELEKLEDILDNAEEKFEYAFGYDD